MVLGGTLATHPGGVSIRMMKASVHHVSVIVGTARRWAAISAGGNVRQADAGRGFRTRGGPWVPVPTCGRAGSRCRRPRPRNCAAR